MLEPLVEIRLAFVIFCMYIIERRLMWNLVFIYSTVLQSGFLLTFYMY